MNNGGLLEVGEKIRIARNDSGLSQQELAEKSGVDRSQISKIEKGLVEGVTFLTLQKICNALGMSLMPLKGFETDVDMRPFVKWAGGKTQLLEVIKSHLPKTFGDYYEPFVGGGAVLFKVAPSSFHINDSNPELICVYQCLCDDELFERLLQELDKHQMQHSEDHYYEVRNMDHNPGFLELPIYVRAGRMIYLNKACFNGLYRVNSKGFFNVPSGKKKSVTCYDLKNLAAIHDYFVKTKPVITLGDFEAAVEKAKAGDFVYFDPPYDTWEEKDSFTSYSKDVFGKEAQRRLADTFKRLADKGVFVMLSNHNTKFISELYAGFCIHIVPAKRMINSKADGRGAVEEVLITNYEN